jgi:Prokaryotic phospholipase A2
MRSSRLPVRPIAILVACVAAAAVVGAPAPAARAQTRSDKLAVLTSWTQPTTESFAAWNAARTNRAAWAAYGFDWSTDYCTDSPDEPVGFDFRLPCARHDFGHRNYNALGLFAMNSDRVDAVFLADMNAVCARYPGFRRALCRAIATVYYTAARTFGSLARPPAGPIP